MIDSGQKGRDLLRSLLIHYIFFCTRHTVYRIWNEYSIPIKRQFGMLRNLLLVIYNLLLNNLFKTPPILLCSESKFIQQSPKILTKIEQIQSLYPSSDHRPFLSQSMHVLQAFQFLNSILRWLHPIERLQGHQRYKKN